MTPNTQFVKNYLKFLMAMLMLFVIGIFVIAYFDEDDGYVQSEYYAGMGQYYHHQIEGDIRYLVPNVNESLAKLIPDNVHYVSYHPKLPKAVYCYYPTDKNIIQENVHHFNIKPFSKCYFIKLIDDRVQTDDISDLIRINLQIYYKNSGSYFKSNLYADNPYVEKWVDRDDLLYGMVFVVNPEFNRFGWGDFY